MHINYSQTQTSRHNSKYVCLYERILLVKNLVKFYNSSSARILVLFTVIFFTYTHFLFLVVNECKLLFLVVVYLCLVKISLFYVWICVRLCVRIRVFKLYKVMHCNSLFGVSLFTNKSLSNVIGITFILKSVEKSFFEKYKKKLNVYDTRTKI